MPCSFLPAGHLRGNALGYIDKVMIREGDVTSYVEGLLENRRVLEGLPEQMRAYFDYARLSRDIGGTTVMLQRCDTTAIPTQSVAIEGAS